MQTIYLIRRLLFCCLVMLGGTGIVSAQIISLDGITGPKAICKGSTATFYANYMVMWPTPVSNVTTWSITPAVAGSVQQTTSGFGTASAEIQWNVSGPAVITAVTPNGTFTRNVQVESLPEPILTTNVQLACQPLGQGPKEEEQAGPRFNETNCQWVCENSDVLYSVTGTPGSTYTWTVTGPGSASPAGSDCYVHWDAPGNGMVTVTETTTAGCKASKSMCVKIQTGPTAKFNILFTNDDPVVICRGGQVVINDQSAGTPESPIVSWHWDFSDGQVSNQSPGAANNPIVHQYNDPGSYKIILTVTNSCGCSATMYREVVVKESPAPVITCPRVVCEGEVAEYTVDQRCDPSSWNVEGGTILSAAESSVTVLWDHVDPATGFGYVTFTGCEECRMTAAVPVPVVLHHAEIQGLTNICVNQEYVYRLPKWPTTAMDWYIASGNGYVNATDQPNEIVVVATAPGPIQLACAYTNTLLACGGNASITIQANPQTQISGPQQLCKGQSGIFTAGGYTANWQLMDANGNYITGSTGTTFAPGAFSQAGTYTVTATGNDFCPVGDFTVTVKELPAAPTSITGPAGACAGVPIKYSAGPAVAGTTFLWAVSSGSVNAATGAESFITFAGAPNYTVTVKRITNDALQCASAAFTKIVTDPIPALTIYGEDTVCHSTNQGYSLNYNDADDYEWSIVPASLGSVTNNAFVIGNPGPSNVSISWNVPPGQGAMATVYVKVRKCNTYRTDSIKVFVRGVPGFIAKLRSGLPDTTVCSGAPITLQLVPSYPVTSVGSVSWEWGDGSQVFNGPGFTTLYGHVYNTSGGSQVAFEPVVTIKDPNGCLGKIVTTGPKIYVKPAPVAFITPEGPIAQCDPVFNQPLTATLTTGIGGSNTFTWSPAAPNSPNINATALGFYSVTVSNSNGCSATSNIVEIKHGCPKEPCGPGTSPAIVLTGSNSCGTLSVHAAVTGPTMAFDWIYPTSVTPAGPPTATDLVATVDQAGMYQFDYLAYYRNNAGDTCAVDSAITVLVPYMAGLRYEVACNQAGGNYKITLADRSSLYPTVNVTRTYYNASWTNLGSGLSVVTNAAGGTSNTYYMVIRDVNMIHPACTATVTVALPVFPVADFSLAGNPIGCVGNAFNFWNASQGAGLTYLWNYGTAQSQSADGGVVYAAPVTNNPVTLTVTDQYGCTSVKSQLITANANPYTGALVASPNPACQGTPVNLSYSPINGGFPNGQYTWFQENTALYTSFGPGNSYNVTEPGGYWIKATGIYGCVAKTNTVPVVINQIPLPVISGNSNQCANVPFTLTTDFVEGATYAWTALGWGATYYTSVPSIELTQSVPTAYSYVVTVTLNGCTRTSPQYTVIVNPPPAPPVVSMDIHCDPYTVVLNANGGSTGIYNWSNGGYGEMIETYQGGAYQVVYTDEYGCKSNAQITVPKDPREYLWIFPSGCFCKLRLKTYVIGPIIPFEEWHWIQDGSPVNSGTGIMPPFYPSPGHTYNMSLNNGYCEVMSDPMYYDNEMCERIDAIAADAPSVAAALKAETAMQLVPNPARETAAVLYSFTPGSHDRYIEVYDMIGRKLQTHAITKDRGELVLPVAKFSAGMYQVVMKENGVTVQQSKLSLTR